MNANEILQGAREIFFTLSTVLNNTVTQEWAFEDMLGGGYSALGGSSFANVDYLSNAHIRVSNKAAPNGPSHEIVTSGLTLVQSLDGKFDTSVSTTYATVSLLNTRTDDDFSLRNWKDKVFDVRVGGVIDYGQISEERLTIDGYKVWFNGVINDFTVNRNSIDLSLGLLPSRLQNNAPVNNFRSGESEGLAVPYILGSVNGFSPSRVRDGLFKFHDGAVASQDEIMDGLSNSGGLDEETKLFDLFPSVSLGRGRDYYHDLEIGTIGGFVDNDGSGTLINGSAIEWSQTSETLLTDTGSNNLSVECDNTLALSFSDKKILVSNSAEPSAVYGYSDFTWLETDTGFISNRGLVTEVTTTGAIISGGVGGHWFKFRANGSGFVRLDFNETVSSLRMMVRNVNSNFQTISSINPPPDSITPPLPFDGGTNHSFVFSELNSKFLTFNYSATTEDQFVAIWFEEVQVKEPAVGVVRLDFENDVNDIDIDINTTNFSQNIISSTITNSSTVGFSKAHSISLEIGSGNVEIDINSFRNLTSGEGVSYSVNQENITITPRAPRSDNLDGGMSGFRANLPSLGQQFGSKTNWRIKFRARHNSPAITSISAIVGTEPLAVKIVQITQDWKEFDVTLEGTAFNPFSSSFETIRPKLYLGVHRGDFFGDRDVIDLGVYNPSVGFQVEIDYIEAYPIGGDSSRVQVFYIDQGSRVKLRTYRVKDATRYINKLPEGLALYDSNGNICVSPNYQNIVGNFNGEEFDIDLVDACRKVSRIGASEDLILTDLVNTPIVGHVLSEQKPAIEHISDLLLNTDHFYQESLDTDNITIRKRYDAQSYPSDFVINDLLVDSVTRTGSEAKERRYIVEYDRDFTDSSFSKYSRSEVGAVSDLDTRTLTTALKNKPDAESIASLIARDSNDNGLYQASEYGVGLEREVDHAGVISDKDVPPNRPAIIKSVTQSTGSRSTTYLAKVLEK